MVGFAYGLGDIAGYSQILMVFSDFWLQIISGCSLHRMKEGRPVFARDYLKRMLAQCVSVLSSEKTRILNP